MKERKPRNPRMQDPTEKARLAAAAEIEQRLDAPAGPGKPKEAKAKASKPAKVEKAAKADKPAKVDKPSKADRPAKAEKAPKPKALSALDAAAQVLAASDKPMRAIEIVGAMAKQGLWKSAGGKTPEATIYAAILREIQRKGPQARFRKVERGLFASSAKGA